MNFVFVVFMQSGACNLKPLICTSWNEAVKAAQGWLSSTKDLICEADILQMRVDFTEEAKWVYHGENVLGEIYEKAI